MPKKTDLPGMLWNKSQKWELGAAVVLTALALYFRGTLALHGGGLWRDEANTVALAAMPSLRDLWIHLQFDSFPLVWPVLLRVLTSAGMVSDLALRAVGLVVGIFFVAGLWFASRTLGRRPPVVSLLLAGLCPGVFYWGGTVRAYGMGILMVALIIPLVWKYVQTGGRGWLAALLSASLLGVHTLYYNAVIVLACFLGGCAVLAVHRDWKRIILLLSGGAFCAATMLPYFYAIRGASEWNMLCQVETYDPLFFMAKLYETLSAAGVFGPWLWFFAVVAATFAALFALFFNPSPKAHPVDRDLLVFSLATLWIGLVAYYLFLSLLHYPTQPWYYLALLALAAVVCDAVLGSASRTWVWISGVVLLLVLGGALFTFQPARAVSQTRLTNSDLVAGRLLEVATERDLVLVNPWYVGVSFNRYYRGRAPWQSLPPVDEHGLHRYDFIKAKMVLPDQAGVVEPTLAAIRKTLQAGGRLYIVGGIRLLRENEQPLVLSPAPGSVYQWQDGPYYASWSSLVVFQLQRHARTLNIIPVPVSQPVNGFENSPLFVFEGWRE